ncbi:MAG: hypothetical protein KDE14_10750 [Rhodobacteraceae bacterium]|nr:hypothetical protein [Paracoccaceae bacterium]
MRPVPGLTDCDRLAANPPDPDRIAPGVEREDVDLPKAIAACRAAVTEYPDVARLAYQLGRCLFYSGQSEEALRSFEQAAAQGYRQAHFIIGLIVTRRYAGVAFDAARIERHWRAAAELGHFNAQISYVRAALRGVFDALPDRADDAEMKSFLADARDKAGYLGGLLVDDLTAELAARSRDAT